MKRKSKKHNFQTLRWLWYSILFGMGFGLGWVLRRLYGQQLKTGALAATTAQTATTMAAMKGKDELADQLIGKQAELARLSADWAAQLKAKDDELKATAAAHALHTSTDWPAQLAGKERELAQIKQQHHRALAELTAAATASTASALRAKDAEIDALKIQINNLNMALQMRDAELASQQERSQTRSQTPGQADDFKRIKGIGPVLEQRLFNAGICTYEALMKTSEVRLAEICNSSKRVRTPDYASWIAQAEALAAAKANAL